MRGSSKELVQLAAGWLFGVVLFVLIASALDWALDGGRFDIEWRTAIYGVGVSSGLCWIAWQKHVAAQAPSDSDSPPETDR